ncbi:fumarate hydratase [Chloroflexota bacterium]
MAISTEILINVSAKLYEKACKTVPADVQKALNEAYQNESSYLAREQFKQMLENISVAKEDDNVICQDLGIPHFFVKYGTKVQLEGDLRDAISKGMKKLYEEPPHLWTYHINPLNWTQGLSWEGINTPFIYIDLLPGAEYIQLTAFPKGTGSSMWGKVNLYEPQHATLEHVTKFVLDCLLDAGPRACPPYIIGVGIGGTLDSVAHLAKMATMRPLNKRHKNSDIANMERKVLHAVNETGIGVMGLGGDTTALAVNINYASTHFYRTPLAFELNCWPGRQASATIYPDGSVKYTGDD